MLQLLESNYKNNYILSRTTLTGNDLNEEQLNLKANVTDVDTALALKSNINDTNIALNLKANITNMNTALNLKQNTINNAAFLDGMTSNIQTQLSTKQNVSSTINMLSSAYVDNCALHTSPTILIGDKLEGTSDLLVGTFTTFPYYIRSFTVTTPISFYIVANLVNDTDYTFNYSIKAITYKVYKNGVLFETGNPVFTSPGTQTAKLNLIARTPIKTYNTTIEQYLCNVDTPINCTNENVGSVYTVYLSLTSNFVMSPSYTVSTSFYVNTAVTSLTHNGGVVVSTTNPNVYDSGKIASTNYNNVTYLTSGRPGILTNTLFANNGIFNQNLVIYGRVTSNSIITETIDTGTLTVDNFSCPYFIPANINQTKESYELKTNNETISANNFARNYYCNLSSTSYVINLPAVSSLNTSHNGLTFTIRCFRSSGTTDTTLGIYGTFVKDYNPDGFINMVSLNMRSWEKWDFVYSNGKYYII